MSSPNCTSFFAMVSPLGDVPNGAPGPRWPTASSEPGAFPSSGPQPWHPRAAFDASTSPARCVEAPLRQRWRDLPAGCRPLMTRTGERGYAGNLHQEHINVSPDTGAPAGRPRLGGRLTWPPFTAVQDLLDVRRNGR